MKPYTLSYHKYFGRDPGIEVLWDEYEYIVNNRLVVANDIHHIYHGANKYDDIDNWMALTRDNHEKAHAEKLDRYLLKEIHLKFLEQFEQDPLHPYKMFS